MLFKDMLRTPIRKLKRYALKRLLSELEPGFQELDVFNQFARLNRLTAVELVCLRPGENDRVEVLLRNREPDDRIWTGRMLHSSGTISLATDNTESDYTAELVRLGNQELGGIKISVGPVLFQPARKVSTQRGEITQIGYWGEVRTSRLGVFVDTQKLGGVVLPSEQPALIARAEASYRRYLAYGPSRGLKIPFS